MKFKELETKGLTGEALTFAESFNANMSENLAQIQKEFESKSIDMAPVQKLMDAFALEVKKLIPESGSFAKAEELKSLENDLIKRINEQSKKEVEVKSVSLQEMIIESMKGLEIKSANDFKAKLHGTDKIKEFELKDAVLTTDYTGFVTRTQQVSMPKFAPITPNAFFGVAGLGGGTVDNGKSILMWIPSSYTSNVGYVGENSAIAADDAATAEEKSRQMAKISAKLPITEETFSDLPQFAQRLTDQLTRKASSFVDTELYSGDGNDATQKNHIYGIKTQGSTAFDVSEASPYLGMYPMATILELIDACGVMAEEANYKVNTCRLHPRTASKLRRLKDTTGQPIVQTLVNGSPSIGGLRLLTSSKIGVNEMLVSDDALIQLWTKRSMDLRIGQIATGDVENDRYTAILFARYQCLVEDADKAGVIYVADVDAAVTAITKGV